MTRHHSSYRSPECPYKSTRRNPLTPETLLGCQDLQEICAWVLTMGGVVNRWMNASFSTQQHCFQAALIPAICMYCPSCSDACTSKQTLCDVKGNGRTQHASDVFGSQATLYFVTAHRTRTVTPCQSSWLNMGFTAPGLHRLTEDHTVVMSPQM